MAVSFRYLQVARIPTSDGHVMKTIVMGDYRVQGNSYQYIGL